MLSKKQEKAIRLLFEGNKTRKQIADELKISEGSLYVWQNKPEFIAAMRDYGLKYVKSSAIVILIKNQIDLALNARSEMVRFQATADLLNRIGFSDEAINEEQKEDENKVFVQIVKGEPKKYDPSERTT